MVFFVKSVKHTFYTLHTIIPDFGDVRKLTGYSPFTIINLDIKESFGFLIFYVFFNFGYGSEIGNFAEVYPHFLSLLFLKSHSDFTGI